MKFMQELNSHLDDYILLAAGLIFLLLFFVVFMGNDLMEKAVIISGGILYLAWGVWHHEKEKDLNLYIVLEYGLTAFLAIVFMFGVITNL